MCVRRYPHQQPITGPRRYSDVVEPVTAVLVGAGQRGRYVYAAHAARHPDRLRIVAVVDPDEARREATGNLVDVPPHRRLDMLDQAAEIDADAWIVASPDRHHHEAAATAIDLGLPVLLEKPMAATIGDTVALVSAAEARGVLLAVGHVLRYTPFFKVVNDVIRSGRLGELVTVEHRENVVAWHMAHSFVRGNWARSEDATPMIVAKCCHDFDVLTWNLDSPVQSLSSVGSLFEFRPDRAPPGATARCVDPCPVTQCPFDARRIYLDERVTGWPVHVVSPDPSRDARLEALRFGPYGRCVYTAGSDVVDHQVVSMQLVSGASVVLVMHGHSHEEARTMRYDGTRATLRALFGPTQTIEVTDHAGGQTERIPVGTASGGHGGGDSGIIDAFVASVRTGAPLPTTAGDTLESHFLAFASEEARIEGTVIDMAAYRSRHGR